MNRSRLATPLLLLVMALTAAVAGCRREASTPPLTPRDVPVFIISIDTLRSDRLPAYGYNGVETPAIDRFRRDAVLFRNAFSNSPLTLPSHASMMTGRLPYANGVRDNLGYKLESEQKTLASILADAGYETGGAVSSFVLRKEAGIGAGFRLYDDVMTTAALGTMTSWQRDGDRTREVLTRWLDSTQSTKLFGFLHLYEPHMPYTPPEPYASLVKDPYDGEIAYADAIVGRFLDTLRSKGLYDQSLIILLSDHGEGLGDHGEMEHGVLLYRESIQVPLLVKLPGNDRGGDEEIAVASISDVMPTVLGRLGLRSPLEVDGIDLFAAPDGGRAGRTVYSETFYPRTHYGWSELMSLIGQQYHFIEAPRVEVYDYKADPGETKNVAEQQRRLVAASREQIRGVTTKHPFQFPTAADPEEVAKLAALGYLGSGATVASGALPDPKDNLDLLEVFGRGAGYLQLRQYEKAIGIGRDLVKQNPGFLQGWGLISAGYEQLGRDELALDALKEIMKRAPGSAQTALSMAAIYLRLGRVAEAREHAELARSSTPAFAVEMLAQIAMAAGDLPEAEARANEVLGMDASRVQPMLVLAQVRLREERYDEALGYLDRARAAVDTHGLEPVRELEFKRGETLLRLRRVAEAEAAFRRETELFPDHHGAWANLALVVGAQGRGAEAEAVLDRALRANPGREMRALVDQSRRIMREGR